MSASQLALYVYGIHKEDWGWKSINCKEKTF